MTYNDNIEERYLELAAADTIEADTPRDCRS